MGETIVFLRDKRELWDHCRGAGWTASSHRPWLSELEDADMIHRVETHNSPKLVRWALTKKGEDIMPVLMRLVAFGSRWFPERIFEDERPRTLAEIYPENGGNHPWITGAPD